MKVNYRREVDILLVWLSDEPFEYSEESEGVITYFPRPVNRFSLKYRVRENFC